MSVTQSNFEFEHSDCPICGPAPSKPVLVGTDFISNRPGQFPVVECANCHLLRTEPRPTQDTIGEFYPDDYGPYLSTTVGGPEAKHDMKSRLVQFAKRIMDSKAHAIPDSKPGRMIEIGCASGSYLQTMANAGWEVEGIEFSPTAAATARALGYDVVNGAIENVDKPAAHYDLIVGWMVLEHFHQPDFALEKLRTWAKPNGMLVMSVPNAGSLEMPLFKHNWYALHVPNHLYHFDPATIDALMRKAGWRVKKIHHHRTLINLVGSAGLWLRERGYTGLGNKLIAFPETGGRLGAALLFPLAWVAAQFGQTGRMTIWAEPA